MSNSNSGNDVAIIGMAGRFPGARNIDLFWQNLKSGVESIASFSKEEVVATGFDPKILEHPNYVNARGAMADIEFFDAAFFRLSPREAEIMDPQHRIFLECAWESLENAGYNPDAFEGYIGVYAGSALNTYLFNNIGYLSQTMLAAGPLQTILGNDRDHLTTMVSYKLNLRGPSVTVQTACSTSLVAVHLACQALINGECDMALAGGVAVFVPQSIGYIYFGGIDSPDGHCWAFDAKARGSVGGNGVGLVVLKRLEDALVCNDYIHAVIKGSAVNNDGSMKVGYTAPSVKGQAEVITEALTVANVDVETIQYVETHGAGTELGDPVEMTALTQAFRAFTKKRGFCAIGSVKTNVGHLDAAAGVTGLIKAVLTLKNKAITPSLNFEQPNPKIDFANSPFFVNTRLRDWEPNGNPRRAGVSSFGLGGTNAHIVLEEAPPVLPPAPSRPWQLLVLSAKNRAALEAASMNLACYLEQQPQLNFADVAYTYQVGRRPFEHRQVVISQKLEEAVSALKTQNSEQVWTAEVTTPQRPIVFMFPGQGTQYINMGFDLYQSEPTFRQQIDYCAQRLQPYLGIDLRETLYPEQDYREKATLQLNKMAVMQPAIFAIEYALAQLLREWGVQPQAMIGYDIGEYVAATIAGVLSLDDALTLVTLSGKLIDTLPSDTLLSIAASESKIQPFLTEKLALAAVNGPTHCLVSGPTDAIENLQGQLAQEGTLCRMIHSSHAYHSKQTGSVFSSFIEQVQQRTLRPPTIPYISTITGTWITATEATNPSYWARHLNQTIRFAAGVDTLLREPNTILLEVGPGQTLCAFARQQQEQNAAAFAISCMRDPHDRQSDTRFLISTLGKLWLSGTDIDWSGFYAHENRRRLPLVTYPFQRQRYWIDPPLKRNSSANEVSVEVESLIDPITDMFVSIDQSTLSAHPRPNLLNPYVAPRNEFEETLTLLWQETIGIDKIGVHDNFFDLGGHSLMATQIISRLSEDMPIQMSPVQFFENPTISKLAELLDQLFMEKLENLSDEEATRLLAED